METQAKVIDLEGKEQAAFDLPSVFNTPIREDVINRVYVALDSHRRVPHGRDPLAGERTTAETNNPPTGRGISRIPRTKGERYSKSGMAGAVASTVHGRLPHPPRAEKVIRKEVNQKERNLALASAIAATADANLVSRRGHVFTAKLPIVVSNDLENIEKIRDVKKFLASIGADKDLERVKRRSKKTSSNLSSLRRTGTGPLFVVANASKLKNALRSLEGVSISRSSDLSVLDLAPGSSPGRLTIWTQDSLANLSKQVQQVGARYES